MVKLRTAGPGETALLRQSGSQRDNSQHCFAWLARMPARQAFDPDVRLKQRGAPTCHSDFWRVCRSKASRAVAVRNVGVLIFMIPGLLEPNQQKRKSITFAQNSSLALTGTAVR
jgi:hypothetical protein